MNNQQLVEHVKRLLQQTAHLDVEVLTALNEMHARKLYLAQGFKSFHAYCVQVLRMSCDSAARRLKVAELVRRYPALVTPLIERREVHLSGLALLTPVVTDENAERLLNEACGKTYRAIEAMVVRENPKSDISSGVRKALVPNASMQSAAVVTEHAVPALQSVSVEARPVGKQVELRSPERYAFRTMMSAETKAVLDDVCDMGATDPDLEVVFREALLALQKEVRVQKRAALKRAPKTPTTEARQSNADDRQLKSDNHAIARDVERAVRERDGHRCTFTGDGGRCSATRLLQLHHIVPAAWGGPATVANLTLHCRSHNIYQAELDFGVAFMAEAQAKGRRRDVAGASGTSPPRRNL